MDKNRTQNNLKMEKNSESVLNVPVSVQLECFVLFYFFLINIYRRTVNCPVHSSPFSHCLSGQKEFTSNKSEENI